MGLLVTDLDGTLLGGDVAGRRRLRAALDRHPEISVVFATGRGTESVRDVLADPLVPRPRWVVADVGATVARGPDLTTDEDLTRGLRAGWPGSARVRAALRRFPELTYQDDAVQHGRCSFLVPPGGVGRQARAAIEAAVAALGCGCQFSGGRFLDVLPAGASKGDAVVALAEREGWDLSSVLVAGDSMNDVSLYGIGAHGVVVGGAERELLAAVAGDPAVYRAELPGAAGILAALARLGWVTGEDRIVVAHHRAPVEWTPAGWAAPAGPSGVVPALRAAVPDIGAAGGARWVAASVAATGPDGDAFPPDPDAHGTGLPLSFVPVERRQWNGHFHGTCGRTLWPALMSEPERIRYDAVDWSHHRAVNARFAEHIGATAARGATVWLHDYDLWLVPGMLRAARPDLNLGLFHHTPFPSPEVFALLPTAAQVRASLARLDWAGFHTSEHADAFRRVMATAGRMPRVGVHPLGVDRDHIEALVRERPRPARPRDGGRLVLSVERLHHTKAPVAKTNAIAALLNHRPDLRGRVTFRLVCPPPEDGVTVRGQARALLERRVHEINDAWGRGSWRPVEYVPRTLSFAEIVDAYLEADVFWVTAPGDGMNLTAKEFAAAHHAAGLAGVLVLSRYAGAAAELAGPALLTDPRSSADLARVLEQALALGPEDRRARMDRLGRRLGNRGPVSWAAGIVAEIEAAGRSRGAGGRNAAATAYMPRTQVS